MTVYVEVRESAGLVRMQVINNGTNYPNRTWDIKVTQIRCDSVLKCEYGISIILQTSDIIEVKSSVVSKQRDLVSSPRKCLPIICSLPNPS